MAGLHALPTSTMAAVVLGGPLASWLLWVAFGRHAPGVQTLTTARVPASAHLVLVWVTDTPESLYQVDQVAAVAAQQQQALLLAYLIIVPPDLPLDAPLPEAEAHAELVVEHARAIAAAHDVLVRTQVRRARETAPALAALARDERAEVIVGPPAALEWPARLGRGIE